MSNLTDHARRELEVAGYFDASGPYDGMIGPAIMTMIEAFAKEGHSGLSASIVISVFERVARFEPLTPLTGADDEWNEIAGSMFQNRRCSHVFKENGRAYDSTGRIFRYPDGVCVTRHGSRVDIEFPYTPTREYVDIPNDNDAAAFEAYLQALEAGGAHVDRADPENEGMWRRHFAAGKPASDFVPVTGDDEAFRQWLAKVLLLGGRVYHDGDDDVPIWRDYFNAGNTPEKAVELAAMHR